MSLPAIIRPDAMPATAKAAHSLVYLDDEGRPIKYGPGSKLLPADLLGQAMVEIDGMNARLPDKEEAGKMGKNLIGAYPNERAKDPITYAGAMLTVFLSFPKDVCWKAIDEITLESEFPPTRAELHKTCAKLLYQRNSIKRAAQAQLAEHERRLALPPPPKRDEEDREAFLARLREKYPAGFGLAQAVAGQGDDPKRGTAPVNRVEGYYDDRA